MGLVTLLVALNILTPIDIGMITFSILIIQFSDIISATGIQQYIAQKEKIDNSTVDSAWTLDVTLKLMTTAIIISTCSILWIINIGNNEILLLIMCAAPTILIKSFVCPEIYIKKRNLEYKSILKIELTQKFASFSTLLILIPTTKSYWSYIVADYVSLICMILLSYLFYKRRPTISFKHIRTQWAFSQWMIMRGAMGYLKAQLDSIVLASLASVQTLGVFQAAKDIAVLPAQDIVRPAAEPLVSAFSRASEKGKEELSLLLERSTSITLFVIIPCATFLYFFPKELVSLLASEEWSGAASVLPTLAFLLVVYSLNPIFTNLYISTGKVKSLFLFEATSSTISVLSLFFLYSENLVTFIQIRTAIATLVFSFLAYLSMKGNAHINKRILTRTITTIAISILSATLTTRFRIITEFENINTILSALIFITLYISITSTIFIKEIFKIKENVFDRNKHD